jgi:hypothetical protein
MSQLQNSARTLGALTATLAALALTACGGDNGSPAAAAPAPTTTVAGAVVKGPVAGAQVCAYTVVANGRGSAVGSCTTSDGQGRYSFNLPVGTGPLWVEASGGSYTDEATNAVTALPAGSSLRSIITANGGNVDSMLTPLTTLALNAAAATAGSTGTLNAAVYAAAAAQLMSAFNLPTGPNNALNINTTLPAFGASANSYGTALTVISRMVANGTTLAALLATTNPQTLAAAYAAAATAPATPAAPPAAPSGGSVALSFSGATDVGPVDTSAFTPGNSTLLQAYEFGVGTANEFLTIIANASVAGSTDPNRSRRFVVQFRTVAPGVGSTFTPPIGTNSVGIQFYQFEDNLVPTPTGRLYNGAGGTVTVVARTASSITVRLSGVSLTPGALFRGLPTTGSFVANGDITAPIQK